MSEREKKAKWRYHEISNIEKSDHITTRRGPARIAIHEKQGGINEVESTLINDQCIHSMAAFIIVLEGMQ